MLALTAAWTSPPAVYCHQRAHVLEPCTLTPCQLLIFYPIPSPRFHSNRNTAPTFTVSALKPGSDCCDESRAHDKIKEIEQRAVSLIAQMTFAQLSNLNESPSLLKLEDEATRLMLALDQMDLSTFPDFIKIRKSIIARLSAQSELNQDAVKLLHADVLNNECVDVMKVTLCSLTLQPPPLYYILPMVTLAHPRSPLFFRGL